MLRLPRFAAAFGGTLLCLLLVRHGRVSSDANGAGLLSGAGGLTGPYRTRCGGRAEPGLFAPAQSLELVEQFQRAARAQFIRIDLLQAPFHRGGRRYGGWEGGRGVERQLPMAVRAGVRGVLRTAVAGALQLRQIGARLRDDLTRHPGELRHREAKAAVRRSFAHRVQKYERVAMLGCIQVHVRAAVELEAEGRELEVMRGKEREGAHLGGQLPGYGPGERQSIEGAGAAPDLVHEHQAPW